MKRLASIIVLLLTVVAFHAAVRATTSQVTIDTLGKQQILSTSTKAPITTRSAHPNSFVRLNSTKDISPELIDLLQEKLGGQCLSCTDEFFAACSNLVKPGRGITNDQFTENGKWMDGWESRRRRGSGHDMAILKLGLPGTIHALDIDTNNFIGNYPYYASVDAANVDGNGDDKVVSDNAQWVNILPKVPLRASSQHLFQLNQLENNNEKFTHLRLHIYPDGGVARLRAYGRVVYDLKSSGHQAVDVAATHNGGVALACSDQHFGVMSNLLAPGRGINMGDGWETRRRRGPGHDWVIVKLGATCKDIERIEVDTAHFKGNYPDSCSIEANYLEESHGAAVALGWQEIVPKTKLEAHKQHYFEGKQLTEQARNTKINYVRLNIYPDGGVSRFRVWCKVNE